MLQCIKFKNDIDTGKQELYFYGDIVSDEMDKWQDTDTCPQDVQNILKQIDENKPLDIYINSGGGSVFAGLAIYNMLKRNKAQKTVHIDGLAASIASVIAMAGDKIIMPSNAFLMIHKAWNIAMGNANDLRKQADDLDKIDEGILNVYKDKLKPDVNIEDIKQMVNAETWLTGKDAEKYFNIDVVENNKAAASISKLNLNLDRYKNVPDSLKKTATKNNKDKEILEDKKVKNENLNKIEQLKAKLALECEI